jgi:hypothetical protein
MNHMPFSSSGGCSYAYDANPNNTCKSLRVARYRRRHGGVWEGKVFSSPRLVVTQSLTFEVSIDACEWQAGVPQLEYDVSAIEQGGQHARESSHMTRIP